MFLHIILIHLFHLFVYHHLIYIIVLLPQLLLITHSHFNCLIAIHLLLAGLSRYLLRYISISLGAAVVNHVSLELLLAAGLSSDFVAGFGVASVGGTIFELFERAFAVGVVT